MKNLIEAFSIFLKYSESENLIRCVYEEIYVDIPFLGVSEEDRKRLAELGFKKWHESYDEDEGGYYEDEDTIFYFMCQ